MTQKEKCELRKKELSEYYGLKTMSQQIKPKQETLEEAVNAFKKTDVYINEIKQKQDRMYSEEDLFKILLDFVAFPHDHMEPRGSIIERYLKELKNK